MHLPPDLPNEFGRTFRASLAGRFVALPALLLALLAGCGSLTLFGIGAGEQVPAQLIPQVLAVFPHDTASYTEGLVWHDGSLYESAGLYGQSSLRKVDPQTGKVLLRTDDPAKTYGEGLALDGNTLVQLTWREGTALLYDLNTFAPAGAFSYAGEGWGLCFDGQRFYMTDGSANVYARDAKSFAITSQISVVQDGKPVTMLNELECVDESLYVNVWKTDRILRLDKRTGRITAVIDASGLLTRGELDAAGPEGVLNGIAYDSTDNTFLITGKFWPKMFQVKFVPKGGG